MPDRKPALDPSPRYALMLLASASEGYTATVLQAYGIGLDVLADLVNAGLITMDEQITAGTGRAR